MASYIPGDIVIFHSGWSDRYSRPFPEGRPVWTTRSTAKRRLAGGGSRRDRLPGDKGIRCVATDGPTLGGVEPKDALMTYWALGSKGMVGVEYLTNVDRMPPGAYFLFAAVNIRGGHGGPGRAIALY